MKRFLIIGALGASVLTACSRTEGPIVAQVGDVKVPLGEVQARLRDVRPEYRQYSMTDEGRKQFLDLVMREKTILAQARKEGFQDEKVYKEAIERFEETQKRQLADYRDSLLVESYLRKLQAKELAVSDADVKAYFEANRAIYETPSEILASHILLNSREEAEAALKELKSGASFEALAKTKSHDPSSASNGGRLPPFKRGSLVPAFEEAADALKPGQISGIIQTQFGFHIIKKTGLRPLPRQNFDQVKEEIKRRMERDRFDQWVRAKQAELKVRIDESVAKTLQLSSNPEEKKK